MSATAPKTDIKERPIVLRSNEVPAVLEGRKTQHRTAINPQPLESWMRSEVTDWSQYYKRNRWRRLEKHLWICHPTENTEIKCPYGAPGDRLWVREALRWTDYLVYDADREPVDPDQIPAGIRIGRDYLPMTHMPRWASRITLEIENVRVERLQEISEADARAEGMRRHDASRLWSTGADLSCFASAKEAFAHGWNSINGKRGYSWDSNPFVWAITFKKL